MMGAKILLQSGSELLVTYDLICEPWVRRFEPGFANLEPEPEPLRISLWRRTQTRTLGSNIEPEPGFEVYRALNYSPRSRCWQPSWLCTEHP